MYTSVVDKGLLVDITFHVGEIKYRGEYGDESKFFFKLSCIYLS